MSNLENKINRWHILPLLILRMKFNPLFMHTQTDYNVIYVISCYDEGIDDAFYLTRSTYIYTFDTHATCFENDFMINYLL